MEFIATPCDFGTGAPEPKAATRKVAFCTRVAHISGGKEFLGHFNVLELRTASRGAF